LADAFARADFGEARHGVILTGPFMPTETVARLKQRAAENPNLGVLGFTRNSTSLVMGAKRVVTMGGYNTISEVLSFGRQALVVPRVEPRREQWLRAMRLRDLGVVDVCEFDRLSPASLTHWLAGDDRPLPDVRAQLDMEGLSRLPSLVLDLHAGRASEAEAR
jgi:predicted glycosyltransferase